MAMLGCALLVARAADAATTAAADAAADAVAASLALALAFATAWDANAALMARAFRSCAGVGRSRPQAS
eukprot:2276510-Rhodomonas_salina.1